MKLARFKPHITISQKGEFSVNFELSLRTKSISIITSLSVLQTYLSIFF